MRIGLCVLFLFLLVPLVTAEGDSDSSSFSQFFNDTIDTIEREGRMFIQGPATAARGAIGAGGEVIDFVYFDVFSPGECGSQAWDVTNAPIVINAWMTPAFFMGLIIILGIVIVYFAGQFLNQPQLITFAKDEGFQGFFTFLRVVFISGAILGANVWYTMLVPDTDPVYGSDAGSISMIDAASAFSRYMVVEMVNVYSMLVMYNMVVHTVYSSTLWIGVTWRAMYSFNLGPVLKPIIDIIGMALQFLSLGISEWMMHIITLCMIKRWTWSLFIPGAMLLRSLPHTRGAGEALFALAFCLGLIYPFMFIIDYEAHKIMEKSLVDTRSAVSEFIHESGLFGLIGSAAVILFLMAGVFIPFFLGGALNLAFELVRTAVYYIAMMSFFLPFLNIFVTLTAARETAKLFNVDVNYLSFLKVI